MTTCESVTLVCFPERFAHCDGNEQCNVTFAYDKLKSLQHQKDAVRLMMYVVGTLSATT